MIIWYSVSCSFIGDLFFFFSLRTFRIFSHPLEFWNVMRIGQVCLLSFILLICPFSMKIHANCQAWETFFVWLFILSILLVLFGSHISRLLTLVVYILTFLSLLLLCRPFLDFLFQPFCWIFTFQQLNLSFKELFKRLVDFLIRLFLF